MCLFVMNYHKENGVSPVFGDTPSVVFFFFFFTMHLNKIASSSLMRVAHI